MLKLERVQDLTTKENIDTSALIKHFLKVNKCSEEDFRRYCSIRSIDDLTRNLRVWVSDYGDFAALLNRE